MATVFDSFNQPLPRFPRLGIQTETSAKSSGSTTEACNPPKCGIEIPVGHWADLATRLCLNVKRHRNKLGSMYLPPLNKSMAFKSEADVVDASASYLRDPVQFAYQLVYPKDVCLKQLTKPRNDVTAASRVDIAYFSGKPKNVKTPGDSNNIFAVVEYKKFKGLSRVEFRKGMVSNSIDYAENVRLATFDKSMNNTRIVLKQATHYASRYKSHFVALCDYETLILLVMTQVEELDGGDYTYMTVIDKSAEMRKAYLGFLLAARLHAQGDNKWRKTEAGKDVFVDAENWQQELQSADTKRRAERKERKSDPTYDIPSSQESDIFKSEVQSG